MDTTHPDIPRFKNFRVTYANGGDETPDIIRVCKDDTANFFQQVVKVFSEFHLDMWKIEITYPVRRKDIGVELLKVKFVADQELLAQSLETMYTYAEPDSHLIVRDILKRPSKARP